MAGSTAEQRRLFVGGLVKGVAEEELVEKFSRFGQVSSVEIKTRTSDSDTKTFAYLNLTAEDSAFKKCFTAYNNTKWKGGQLKLQLAKESFLSRLKKEQDEMRECHEKKENKPVVSVQKSPALDGSKKAVPGTPLDDRGLWVMGKFSQVQPVLRLKKPGSAKLVTVDPSKTLHCLKRLKCEDFDSQHSLAPLTWQLEDNTSHINKLRQGIFPTPPPTHNHAHSTTTPTQTTLASRLQSLASKDARVSDTDMEVVPVGQVNTAKRNSAVISGYHSDDSAGSADTDEIVFKASGKKMNESGKKTPQSSKKVPLTMSGKKGKSLSKNCTVSNGFNSDDSAGSADTDEILGKVAGKATPQSGKKMPLSVTVNSATSAEDNVEKKKKKKQFALSGHTDDGCSSQAETSTKKSASTKDKADSLCGKKETPVKKKLDTDKNTNAGNKQKPQFEFVKNPESKGRVLKKSKKLSQSETLRAADSDSTDDDHYLEDDEMKGVINSAGKNLTSKRPNSEVEDAVTKDNNKFPANKTPAFKGLSMLSSDSEGDSSQAAQVSRLADASHKSGSTKTLERLHKQKETAFKTRPKSATGRTPEFRGLNMLSSDTETEGPLDRSAVMGDTKILSSAQASASVKGIHFVSPPLQQKHWECTSDSGDPGDILCSDSNTSATAPKPAKESVSKKATTCSLEECTEQKKLKLSSCAHQAEKQDKTAVQTFEGQAKKTKSEAANSLLLNPLSVKSTDGLAADAALTSTAKQRKTSKAASDLDDSDLNDNDFEKVGRKLAAQALRDAKGGEAGLPAMRKWAREDNPTSTTNKTNTAQQKSHHSYSKMLKKKQQEENFITKALREGTESKVIKFDSDEEEASTGETPANKMPLFSDGDSDDDSDGSDLNFSFKPQFEGNKGKKLFELQSRIMDKRFRFDERFESDSEGEGDDENDKSDNADHQDSDNDMTRERSRQLEILEKILGYKPRQRTRPVYEPMSKRRYTEDTADQMTIAPNSQQQKTKNKKRLHDDDSGLTKASEAETKKRAKRKDEEDDSSNTVDFQAEPAQQGIIMQDEESAEKEEEKEETESNAKSLKGLFGGGSGFSFFGATENEGDDDDEEPVNTSPMDVDVGGETDDDDYDDEVEKDNEKEEDEKEDEDHGGENPTPTLDKTRLPVQRFQPTAHLQPAFILSRDNPRLPAARRFWKCSPEDEFEELREHWQEKRQGIKELSKERHKKALRKEQMTKKYNSKIIKYKYARK